MNEPIPRVKQSVRPKEAFIREGKRADSHMEMVMSPQFHHAVQVALAQMVVELSELDISTQATTGLQLKGARRFAEVLMNLGVPEKPNYQTDITELTPI